MKQNFRMVFLAVFVFLLIISACTPAKHIPANGLYIVVGNNASRFLGNGQGDGLLLDQFSKENKVEVMVQVANDREISDFRNQMLAGSEDSPDVLIVDDSLYADKLQKVKYLASHKVGVAIRSDVADRIGLNGNVLSFTDFIPLLKSGQISIVASNALAGADSAEFFFSAMAWCSQTDATNLTAEIIQREDVRMCGKDIYSFMKSIDGSNAAIDLVYNAAISGNTNGYNAVVTFDSSLLGEKGLNAKLINQGKPFFKFYYFKEATAQANVALGTKDLSANKSKSDAADLLIEFLVNENSQNAINLAGFTEGSSALVRHNDTAFKAEWGVASNPSGIQIVNPPISSVAFNALRIYRDMYKRTKVTKVCLDVSPSMLEDPKMEIKVGGEAISVFRIQALNRAILKITDPTWLKENEIVPGPNDIFEYYFFAVDTTELVTSSVGTDTRPAGDRINSLIGPWDEKHPDDWSRSTTESKLSSELGFKSNGTEMFDCSNKMLEQIKATYSPEIDYYIIILTDGENNNYSVLDFQFYDNWKNFGHSNIILMGIAFGTDGKSINPGYTLRFGGNTYVGNNDADLIDTFRKIFGN